MRYKLICIACLASISISLFAQQASKPQISSVTVLPSDPVVPTGNCKSSTAGYLEQSRRRAVSNNEIGAFVSKSLHDGYILTVYPASKTGIFVSMQCTNTMSLAKP
jgi:hypothetical protein